MNLATTFHVLEHLNDFQVIGYGGHFVFQNKAKTFADQDLHGLSLHSEAIAPIIREKQGHFSVMTPFNLEVGFIGQIQHLEKIPKAMNSYKLFTHSEPLEVIVMEI